MPDRGDYAPMTDDGWALLEQWRGNEGAGFTLSDLCLLTGWDKKRTWDAAFNLCTENNKVYCEGPYYRISGPWVFDR